MSLRKFNNVSSKSHVWGNKENLPQAKQTVRFIVKFLADVNFFVSQFLAFESL